MLPFVLGNHGSHDVHAHRRLRLVRRYLVNGKCSVPGCPRPHEAHGWCVSHYQRWQRNGAPGPVDIVPFPRATVGYNGAHHRVHRSRGRASDHACVDCGQPARNWSYDHSDPDQLVEVVTMGRWTGQMPFSLDTTRYQPRCVSCHKVFDLAHPLRPE